MIRIRKNIVLYFWIGVLFATPLFFGVFFWWTQCQAKILESEHDITTRVSAAFGSVVHRPFGFWRFQSIAVVLLRDERSDCFDFSVLQDLPHLSELYLYGIVFDEKRVQQLCECQSLQSIGLSNCTITPEQLCKIVKKHGTTRLVLSSDSIDDTFLVRLVSICDICSVSELQIFSDTFTDEAMTKFKELKGLKTLKLSRSPNVSSDAVEELRLSGIEVSK